MKYIVLILLLATGCSPAKQTTTTPAPPSTSTVTTITMHFNSDDESGVLSYTLEKSGSEVATIQPVHRVNSYFVEVPAGIGFYRIRVNMQTGAPVYYPYINVR